MRRVLKFTLATAAMLIATPALAQVANVNGAALSSGGSTTIYFGGPAGTTATSSLYVKLTSANTGTGVYNFDYTLTDTSPLISNLTGFGFHASPTLLAITGTGLNFVLNPVNYPGGFDVDACGTSGNTNPGGTHCDAANNQGDLFAGTFSLTFAGGTSSISLFDFVDRYASLTQLNGASGEGTPIRAVPEPETWAMMLLGFGGIGMAMRRRRKVGLAQIA